MILHFVLLQILYLFPYLVGIYINKQTQNIFSRILKNTFSVHFTTFQSSFMKKFEKNRNSGTNRFSCYEYDYTSCISLNNIFSVKAIFI